MTPPTGTPRTPTEEILNRWLGGENEDGWAAFTELASRARALETALATERARREAAEEELRDLPILSKYHGQRGFSVEEFVRDYEAAKARIAVHFQQYGEGSNNGG